MMFLFSVLKCKYSTSFSFNDMIHMPIDFVVIFNNYKLIIHHHLWQRHFQRRRLSMVMIINNNIIVLLDLLKQCPAYIHNIHPMYNIKYVLLDHYRLVFIKKKAFNHQIDRQQHYHHHRQQQQWPIRIVIVIWWLLIHIQL